MTKTLFCATSLLALFLAGCSEAPQEFSDPQSPPLVSAAEKGDTGRIQTLLSIDNNVNVRDFCQWTPLMKAALNGHTPAVKQLLDAGAGTELGDKGGYTALMLAASNNHGETVQLLLEYGASPDRQENTRGWSALIWAAKQGHLETVYALLAAGADRQLRDSDGKTALDWAKAGLHAEVIDSLQQPPTTAHGPLLDADHPGNAQTENIMKES
ncbi:MAG: ankyrin repeat domain-containing protein [Candidatus Sedimenticola sp. 6PFRAG5]